MKTLIIIITILLSSGYVFSQNSVFSAPFSGPTNYIQQDFDVQSYDAELNFTQAPSKLMSGVNKIYLYWLAQPDTSKFYFHLRGLKIDSCFYEGYKITPTASPSSDTANFHYEIIPSGYGLPNDILYKMDVTITVYYSGLMTTEPSNQAFGGVHSYGTSIYSIGVGFYCSYIGATQHWLPCYDHPSDKAKFKAKYRVPKDYVAASNGLLNKIDTLEDQTLVYEWETKNECATYLLTFAVDKFVPLNISGFFKPVVVYSKPADTTASRFAFNLVPRMANVFQSRYGMYPFEKIGYANTQLGAMEHQTMISYPVNYVKYTYNIKDTVNMIAAHELAHHWFGDNVTPQDFREAWLSEGFATFSESIWLEDLETFSGYIDNQKKKRDQYLFKIAPAEGVFPLYDYPRSKPSSNYPETVYQKGAMVVGMLRYTLGDSVFFDALTRYNYKFWHKSVTTADFSNFLLELTGQDWQWFFNQWVYSKGWPIVDVIVSKEKIPQSDKYKVNLSVNQVQPTEYGKYINVPLEFAFINNSDTTYHIFNMTKIQQSFTIDSIDSYNIIELNEGKSLIALLEIDTMITSVNDYVETNLAMNITPNPANERAVVSLNSAELSKLTITNCLNQVVFTQYINSDFIELNTISLPSGIYYLNASGKNRNIFRKLAVVH